MRLLKRILLGLVIFLVVAAGLFVVFIGPWPTYSSGFEGTKYYTDDIAAIDRNIAESKITNTPGRLKVGWGVALMTPPAGTPMAGFGARKGAPSTGAHDDLYVKAVAFSDGEDTSVVVGSDMLLVPPNVAAMVRKQVAQETPLTPNDIHFGASHTHDGPGSWGPGIAAYVTGGKYNPKIPPFLADAFSKAIIEAYKTLEPGKLASGSLNAEQYIRNRAREAPIDTELSYLVLEKDSGKRCYLVSFSAHPTVVGSHTTQITAEYPGALQRAIERDTGATCAYLGGALGSSGPRAPEGSDDYAKATAMGEALAKMVLDDTKGRELQWQTNLDVASVGIPLEMPPLQVRVLSPKWRLSKFAGPIAGLESTGWMQATRVGNIVFVGLPGDFSSEISKAWKEDAAKKNIDLWTSSFCSAYMGYISPDKYYSDAKGYETGAMSWTGPHQEAFFTALKDHMLKALGDVPKRTPAANAPASPPNVAPST